ncbi:hypothetical protein RQP46_006696 [Phenoliferia psychrophenolica]
MEVELAPMGLSRAPTKDEESIEQPSESQRGVELPPVDRGWAPWRFVLSAFAVDTFVWGSAFTWGTFQSYYKTHAPFASSSAVTIGAVGTSQLAILYAMMFGGILLVRRFPHLVKQGVWISLAVNVLALVVASFAQNVATLIIFQGVLQGAAGGLTYAPIFAYLSEWFVERRALAGGTIFAGAGVGGFTFPLIINALLSRIGFRWTLRVFALMTLIVCGIAIPGLRPRLPIIKPVNGVSQQTPIKWALLWDPSLITLTLIVTLQGFLYSPIITYLPSYLSAFASPFSASLVLSVLNAASIPGQILTGAFCDRVPYTNVMLCSAVVCIAGIFGLLRVGDTLPKMFGFAILIGVFAGGVTSTWFRVCSDVAGKDSQQAGPIFGYLSIVRGVSAIVGPLIAGYLFDPTSTKNANWGKYGLGNFVIFVGVMAVATAGASVYQ